MKTFVVLAVSIVLVSILFCPLAIAAPPMPNDVQIVEPDPSLPKEIADFWGKWEGNGPLGKVFLIVEKIDKEKASLYEWQGGDGRIPESWQRWEANVIKEYGKYKVWFKNNQAPMGSVNVEYTLKGKTLNCDWGRTSYRLTRVP